MLSVTSKIHSLIVYLCSKRNNCNKSNTHFSIVCCVPVTYYVLYVCVRFVFMIIVFITAELERNLIHHNNVLTQSRPNFTIKDLPSVLILIIADQIVNDSLCCSNKYNWFLRKSIGKLYTFLIKLSEICIILHACSILD